MEHETFAVKLLELEERITHIHNRIHLCELSDPEQLEVEMYALQQECTEFDTALSGKLQNSKSDMVLILAAAYQEIEQVIRSTQEALQITADESDTTFLDQKILLTEYLLDFAVQSSNHALLSALEAVYLQNSQQDAERSAL